MIERYTTKPMSEVWSLARMYDLWWSLELAVMRAWEARGLEIPVGTADMLQSRVSLSVEGILEVEKTREPHDLNAFLIFVGEQAPELSRWLHLGLTSSDIKDTTLLMQMVQSIQLLSHAARTLYEHLLEKADTYKELVCVSRTHGQHAEPTTYGLRFLNWAEAIGRAIDGLTAQQEELRIGKFSGPTGQYSVITPDVEERACGVLGIQPIGIATQIIPRDIIASAMHAVVLLACTIEKIALDIRNLSRSEIREVQEGSPHTSSVMAHKKNPSSSETICGLARLVRHTYPVLLENIATWEERDMTQSSVERVVLPDIFNAVHYMTIRAAKLISNLLVDKNRIAEILSSTQETVFSQHAVLALESAGMERDAARHAVERLSREAFEHHGPLLMLLRTDDQTGKVLQNRPAVTVKGIQEAIVQQSRRMVDED